ncbi:His-Xaa-Ser system protein HxsD [Butyrivibrio proteoclasticus]|uniref:His-Xaa-Ser system protein HxsD n=1 Tax=Butyrivibrio proteoclasticus TaxID=43305 RepID=A0A1I5VJ40_9FIRM|nr:His-Xaa-Ser system protein HxsD [Butyrivibrio proteoclasticus]SFQ07451.1 His-Xaa-Ser system protein HxsD [Butyrivibrio proteoclasticus]
MTINYPVELYPKEVLIKASYQFLDQAYIHIDKKNDEYIVKISPKDGVPPISEGDFDNEMLAQAARFVISSRTKNIREITLGRAMASTIIEEEACFDEGDDIQDIDNILKDWFENE